VAGGRRAEGVGGVLEPAPRDEEAAAPAGDEARGVPRAGQAEHIERTGRRAPREAGGDGEPEGEDVRDATGARYVAFTCTTAALLAGWLASWLERD